MAPRELKPPRGTYEGKHRIYGTARGARGWQKLCQSKPGPMRRCYIELADRPFPPGQLPRHHRLKGRLKGTWEYEVSGGDRVRYKRGPGGTPVVTYAGSHPADTA